MKNYLDKMVIKPDYVVTYNANGTYSVNVTNANLAVRGLYINGYAASKSHPDEPVLVSINIPMDGNLKRVSVSKLNPNTYLKEAYIGKHDLFVYNLARNAILAGKEMALYDEADRYADMCKDVTSPIVERITSIINNPLYRRMGQGFIELLTQEYEKRKNDFEPTVNTAKEKAKDAYDKAKNTVKTGVDKLFDEIKNPNKKDDPFWCETEQCALYRELTENYAVTLKHRKNLNGSKYSVTIFNLRLGSEKLYYITREMFHDIYAILESNDHNCENKEYSGRSKFNSIIDILNETPNDGMKYNNAGKFDINKNNNAKTKPIQIVEFRDEDKVESSNLFKRKFNIGDKVVVTDKVRAKYRAYLRHIGTVINISSTGNKTIYVVKFDNGISPATVDLYSNELDTYFVKKEHTMPEVKIQYVAPSANRIDDLSKKMDEHDKVLDKILNVLEDLKKK